MTVVESEAAILGLLGAVGRLTRLIGVVLSALKDALAVTDERVSEQILQRLLPDSLFVHALEGVVGHDPIRQKVANASILAASLAGLALLAAIVAASGRDDLRLAKEVLSGLGGLSVRDVGMRDHQCARGPCFPRASSPRFPCRWRAAQAAQ